MASSTLAAPSVERSIAPAADESSRSSGRHRPGVPWRRLLVAATLAVLVALPVGVQIELTSARRALEADRLDQRMASASARAQRSLVSSSERRLAGADADAAAAATEVEQARVLLAASGVDEQDVMNVLEQTRLWRDTVMLQRADVGARIDQQELDIPAAKACVVDANRALSRGNGSAPPCPVVPAP